MNSSMSNYSGTGALGLGIVLSVAEKHMRLCMPTNTHLYGSHYCSVENTNDYPDSDSNSTCGILSERILSGKTQHVETMADESGCCL